MKINGIIFREMVISAANALDNSKEDINKLNVFPVPDGDTGINMSLTMGDARTDLKDFDGTLSECADKLAGLMLRGARGNSGVILSVFFKGMAKSLKGLEEADAVDMANAMKRGVEDAYKAVMTPTEGTILTVMRVCAEQAAHVAKTTYKDDAVGFFKYILQVAVDTLNKTPDQLPVLKQAQVVDAGGKGFVTVLEGMLAALKGTPVQAMNPEEKRTTEQTADFSSFKTEDIKFGYCTECIITKTGKYVGEDKCAKFHKFAMNIGDSVVFIEDEEIVKVHVHTNDPGRVMSEALRYGSLFKVKVENMRNQHTELADGCMSEAREEQFVPEKRYGFVSVCIGDGIKEVFSEIGTDTIVDGGQSMNPSTEDVLNAIAKVSAENVFVMPNNKNIYMVAKQAGEMTKDRNVIVIPTKSVPEGISAIMAFDDSLEPEENTENMNAAIASVKTLQITFAVKDSKVGDNTISAGETLGLIDGKIACVASNDFDCLDVLVKRVADSSSLTVFTGCDVDEETAEEAEKIIREAAGEGTEVTVIPGGQPLYNYIISAE